MKQLVYALLYIVFFIPGVFAGFGDNSTLVTGPKDFEKLQGSNLLKVHEEYYINPFSSSDIKKNETQTNGSITSRYYTVDNTIFSSSHSKFRSLGFQTSQTTDANGITSFIEYLENTYTIDNLGVYVPNQNVKVRKYYFVTFKFDTTPPTCGEVKFYDNYEGTQNFTYNGGWLNSPKYFTMICKDAEVDCKCAPTDNTCIQREGKVVSVPQLLGHKIQPTAYFINEVNLDTPTCSPGGNFPTILYDTKTPSVDIKYSGERLGLDFETNRIYDIQNGKKLDGIETPGKLSFKRIDNLNFLAENTSIRLLLSDLFLDNSVHGVSGIKNYTFQVFRKTNKSFQSIPSELLSSCSKTEEFPVYNASGNKEITDSHTIDINCSELQKAGKYIFQIIAYDWADNMTKVVVPLNIYPSHFSPSESYILASSHGDKYANNNDTYRYIFYFKDQFENPLFSRDVSSIQQSINGLAVGGKQLLTEDNSQALIFSDNSFTTDIDGKYALNVTSLLPGTFTERFDVKMLLWNAEYIQSGTPQTLTFSNTPLTDNTFKKPFTASIHTDVEGSIPEVGTLQKYNINIQNPGNIVGFSQAQTNLSTDTITFSTQHFFDTFKDIDNAFSPTDLKTSFLGKINPLSETSVLTAPDISSDQLKVRYKIGGKMVSFILDPFSISGCNISTLGLKLEGIMQGDGKGAITGQAQKFSDITSVELRQQVRKNAYTLIKSLTSNTVSQGIKFIDGDITISGEISGYETLIVKNGNVFVSGDLNTLNKKFGIIVLKDEKYNSLRDYNTSGNIYIGKDVQEINAVIYTDGAFISAKADGTLYGDTELTKGLDMQGTLFSQNTIGGAVSAGSEYILPDQEKTTDISLAKIYDLNYIRRVPNNCNPESYSFLIKYNPNIQIDPPKGFKL